MKKIVFGLAAVVAVVGGAATRAELERLVQEDVARPVRPVGVNGQTEYWNVNATWFMYPPSFAFPEKKGADGYRVRIVDAAGKVHLSDQTNSVVSLEKLWNEIPAGRTEVWCDAYHRWATWTVARSFRVFCKMSPYRPGGYPKAPRSAAEAAKLCSDYLLGMPWLKTYAETGKPDPTYRLNTYPAKMDSAVVNLMCDVARLMPERRAAALKLAHAAADHLLSISQPADAPLAHFPPTYLGKNYTSAEYAGMNMLVHPAEAGCAYLKLHAETKEVKYLVAARQIGETYLRLQGADGTWYLKMYEKTGKPVAENRLHPVTVIDFMDALFAATGDGRFRASADRAFGFFERGPLRDWNWEGQFEDVEPTGKYENLTKHPACSLAIRIAKRWPEDANRLAQARELLRFAEDQFVVWDRPKGDDADSLLALHGHGWDSAPAVVEQYYYREAVDASAAKMVNTYLALYEATKNPLDLAKARTLGEAMIRIQKPDGRIQTIWSTEVGKHLQSDWVNCMASSVKALVNLSRFEDVPVGGDSPRGAESRPERMTRVVIYSDTEDYTCDRANDGIRDFANVLTEEGVRGCFNITGYLALRIQEFGRQDVIRALKPHCLGTQTLYHSLHPTPAEIADDPSYERAYRRALADESKATAMVEAVFGEGRSVFTCPPGKSISPSAMEAWYDLGYVFAAGNGYNHSGAYGDQIARPGYEVDGLWYANLYQPPYTAVFALEDLITSETIPAEKIKAWLDQLAKYDFAGIGFHPSVQLKKGHWDAYNYKFGNNVEWRKWNEAPDRPQAETDGFYRNLRAFLRAMKADGRFAFTDFDEMLRRIRPRVTMKSSDLKAVRASLEKDFNCIRTPASWSVADCFCAVVGFLRGETAYKPGKVYGFLARPQGVKKPVEVTRAELEAAAKKIDLSTFLPPTVEVGGKAIGPADFLFAALEVLTEGKDRVTVSPREQLGSFKEVPELENQCLKGTWLHKKDFKDKYVSERFRLLLWTLRIDPVDWTLKHI